MHTIFCYNVFEVSILQSKKELQPTQGRTNGKVCVRGGFYGIKCFEF